MGVAGITAATKQCGTLRFTLTFFAKLSYTAAANFNIIPRVILTFFRLIIYLKAELA